MVCSGLSLRGLGAIFASKDTAAAASHDSNWQMQIGIASLLCAAMCYALLGVTYQTLVSSSDSPPTHTDIMLQSSKIGGTSMIFVCSVLLSVVHFVTANATNNMSSVQQSTVFFDKPTSQSILRGSTDAGNLAKHND